MTAPPSDPRPDPPARPRVATHVRVLVAGVAISCLLAAWIGRWELRGLRQDLRELATERTELLSLTMGTSMQVLRSVQSLHVATGRLSRDEFLRFARDTRARHPELQALEWAPRVAAAQRAGFESAMRAADGGAGFSISDLTPAGATVAAAARPAYYPVQWVEPVAGNEAARGLDLAQDPLRDAALERARAARQPAATAPLRLAQERQAQPGFLVFLPLYAAAEGGGGGDRGLEGFAVAVFRFGDLIRHAMRGLDDRGIAFGIDDIDASPPVSVYASGDASAAPASELPGLHALAGWIGRSTAVQAVLTVGDRHWRLEVAPDAGFLAHHLPWQTLAALLAGLVVTALAAASVRLLTRRSLAIAHANAALRDEVVQRELAVEAATAASRSKTTFLANLSHEIRTPMNAVLGYAQLLRRDARLDAPQRDIVTAIISGGNHLMQQINEVLDFSKIESGRLELHPGDVDLAAVLRDLETMFGPRCREKGLALVVERLPANAAGVRCDGVKLQQILVNLVGNAVRFTRVGEVALRAHLDDDGCHRFEVIDTGPGIPAEEHERIFEPFHQVPGAGAEGGSGLGLAIARRQAELMGGTLAVASGDGAGAVFTLRLRLERTAAPLPAAASDAPWHWVLVAERRLHALVVDDDAPNRDVLARLLAEAGCRTSLAAHADEGLARLDAADADSIDVVFMDIRLPGDPDGGLAAIAAIRARAAAPPVVAYTAAAFDQDRARFLAAGCAAVVNKPIAVEALFETLAAVCGARFERRQLADDDEAPLRQPDLARLRVPPALLERMITAAELHSATVMKAALAELEGLGPEHDLLARHLRRLLRAYDMKAIARLLATVPEGLPEEAPR